jgi:hypothetical protein
MAGPLKIILSKTSVPFLGKNVCYNRSLPLILERKVIAAAAAASSLSGRREALMDGNCD